MQNLNTETDLLWTACHDHTTVTLRPTRPIPLNSINDFSLIRLCVGNESLWVCCQCHGPDKQQYTKRASHIWYITFTTNACYFSSYRQPTSPLHRNWFSFMTPKLQQI